MKIFAGHDGGSGCMYWRMKLPMDQLAAHGHDVTMASADTDKGKLITASTMAGHDVIVAQRFNKPSGVHVYREARTPYSRLVYEVDDDVFHITPENFVAYRLWQRPDILDACTHAMEVSDLVTCTTEPLAEILREYNPNVAVLPNLIPGWVCDAERKRRDRPAVGWAGGASHGVDVAQIVSPVSRFLKRFPGWDLRLAGTDYRPTFKAGNRAVFTRWVHVTDDDRGYFTSPDWDIGLAPLAPSAFNSSKSNIKALEYAALGIPVIASDWPPYHDFVKHGETGFLVRRDHEWLGYMSELASDDALREKMGAAAREQARKWTIEEGWTQWENAYKGLFR
jgi:glycosyltransferase involved in cell wall biosynthesis